MPQALKSHADSIREILRDELDCAAEWRREKAEEYPDDERNLEAAALLHRIAATVDEIDDSIARLTRSCSRMRPTRSVFQRCSARSVFSLLQSQRSNW